MVVVQLPYSCVKTPLSVKAFLVSLVGRIQMGSDPDGVGSRWQPGTDLVQYYMVDPRGKAVSSPCCRTAVPFLNVVNMFTLAICQLGALVAGARESLHEG